MAFVLAEFVQNFEEVGEENRVSLLKSLKKTPLLAVSIHYQCDTSSSMTKAQILRMLMEHLVEEELLPEEAEPGIPQRDSDGNQAIELRRLELEMKVKEMEMQERQREREMELQERQREREMQEKQRER